MPLTPTHGTFRVVCRRSSRRYPRGSAIEYLQLPGRETGVREIRFAARCSRLRSNSNFFHTGSAGVPFRRRRGERSIRGWWPAIRQNHRPLRRFNDPMPAGSTSRAADQVRTSHGEVPTERSELPTGYADWRTGCTETRTRCGDLPTGCSELPTERSESPTGYADWRTGCTETRTRSGDLPTGYAKARQDRNHFAGGITSAADVFDR